MSGSFSFLKGRQHSLDTSHGRDLEGMLTFQVAAGPGKSFSSSVSGIGQKQVEKLLKGPCCFCPPQEKWHQVILQLAQ